MSKPNTPPAPDVAPPTLPPIEGMTLRDWFAGQALAGFFAHPTCNNTAEDFAELAYDYADAMLEQRGVQ